MTTVTDEAGTTSFVYDARGNVVQDTHVIDGVGYAMSYAYDLADHVAQITYPSGRIASFTRDAMGRIAGITTQANSAALPVTVASGATYAPFGPLTGLAYGNGLNLSVSYDEDYQPSARLVAGTSSTVQDLSYGVDPAGDITGIADLVASARSQTFQYDALYRLTFASGLYGALAYGYDAVGNRTSQSGGTTSLAEIYGYAVNSNQLLSVANGTTVRALSYTPPGDVASENFGNGTVLTYGYDLANRLVQLANQTQVLAMYDHNYLGQRVVKDVSGTPKKLHKHINKHLPPPIVTHFHYDRAGHLLAETDGGTAAALKEYVWLDDVPVGLVSGGAVYFIHPDHLGTSQKITDSTQALAYDAVLRPFGEAQQLTAPALTNLRFPGQYFDSESGLAQNWFRDYDATVGRYIESDPLGLTSGLNVFGYVYQRPTSLSDVRGLEVTRWGRPADLACPLCYFDHQWLKTDTQEAGMGGPHGDVPAQGGRSDPPYTQTQTVDHSGQSKAPNAHQIPIPFPVNEDCVNRLIKPGRKTGRWAPWNQCQSFVDDVLEQCRSGPKPLEVPIGP